MSFVFVIFGATGDLSKKKLVPSFYELMLKKKLKSFNILAVARKDLTTEQYCKDLVKFYKKQGGNVSKNSWNDFCKKIEYCKTDFTNKEDMYYLANKIKKLKLKNHIYYLATIPQNYKYIIKTLKKHKLHKQKEGWRRVVLEKPFGYDLKSVIKVNHILSTAFKENQIFRIDHYLGKEAVEDIMIFRFGNVFFDQLLNNKYVDHVQITALETVGIEERGGFYDKTGALKDMVQSHLMQLLMFIGMERPKVYDAGNIRYEKYKVLSAAENFNRFRTKRNFIRAQYTGYKNEKFVENHSSTETFVAFKMFINNSKWKGVPFYIRTGKKLKEKHSLIYVKFKNVNLKNIKDLKANSLEMKIYPNMDISLYFNTKVPGKMFEVAQAKMNFCYSCLFGENTLKDYTVLLNEVINGDLTLFTSWPAVKESWKIINNIPRYWNKLLYYNKKSFGPKEADELIKRDGREWHI